MADEVNKVDKLLHADMKMDRLLERLDDVESLTRIIHHHRGKGSRSSVIAAAIVKFLKEG
jgi:hypothetical protein